MKLFNAIIIYDYFVVAENGAEAIETLKFWIEDGAPTSEQKAMEARDERNIRLSWRDQRPLVGSSISDGDFEKHIKGHTTLDVFQHIYSKRG